MDSVRSSLCISAIALAVLGGCGPSRPECVDPHRVGSERREAPWLSLPEVADWVDVGIVIDTGPFGSWDTITEGISPAAVVRIGDEHLLYYVGSDDYNANLDNIGPAHRSIGVALSSDGIRWLKPEQNPVLTFTATGNHEEGAVSAGMFVDREGTLLAYYGANVAPTSTSSQVQADVRLATSRNGFRFDELGKVVDHASPSVWGYGDEIHPTLALQQDGTFYVYYVPNGTPQGGLLGYCRGSSPTSLADCGPVIGESEPVPSRGPSSVVPIGADTLAFFVSNRGTLDAYEVSSGCLTSFGAPSKSYPVGKGAIVTLDVARRTWFMYYDYWTHIEAKVAPAGPRDRSPPAAPPALAGNAARHDSVRLRWGAASDPDSGILAYNVYRDGERIGSTRDLAFEDTLLAEQTMHEFEVRAVNLHGAEGPGSTLSVRTLADTVPPSIESVEAIAAGEVRVRFDEPVASVEVASFTLGDGVEVIAASTDADPRVVVLGTTAMESGAQHVLTAKEVPDRAARSNRGGGERGFTVSAVPGLFGYWSMDTQGSPGIDTSGSAHHANVFGAPRAVAGRERGGLALSGRDYLEIVHRGALDELVGGEGTIAAWVRPADLPPRSDTTDAAYAILSGPGGLELQYRFDGAFVAWIGPREQRIELASQPFVPGAWHHVALVLSASRKTLALYVDGEPVEGSPAAWSGTRVDGWRSPTHLEYHSRYRIGVANPLFSLYSHFFRGSLDEVRLYDRALTSAEIGQIRVGGPIPSRGASQRRDAAAFLGAMRGRTASREGGGAPEPGTVHASRPETARSTLRYTTPGLQVAAASSCSADSAAWESVYHQFHAAAYDAKVDDPPSMKNTSAPSSLSACGTRMRTR